MSARPEDVGDFVYLEPSGSTDPEFVARFDHFWSDREDWCVAVSGPPRRPREGEWVALSLDDLGFYGVCVTCGDESDAIRAARLVMSRRLMDRARTLRAATPGAHL